MRAMILLSALLVTAAWTAILLLQGQTWGAAGGAMFGLSMFGFGFTMGRES